MVKNNQFRKVIWILLPVLVIISMAGCSSTETTQEPSVSQQEPSVNPDVSSDEVEEVEEVPEETQVEEVNNFDWKKYAGTSIRVYIADSGEAVFIRPHIEEFETQTGIKVEFETADATSYRTNLPVQLLAQSSDFDVMATFPSVDMLQFSANGWYESMDKYIADKDLTSPDYDFSDFPEGVQNANKLNGETISIPWEVQTDLVYYRKDLLEQANLEVPTTFDEWVEAFQIIHNPPEVFGVALRGTAYQMTTPFSSFLYGNCGTWTANGQANINSSEALEAFEMYGKWTNFGPPGIINFDWQVPAQQFSQGLVFAFLDINLFVPTLEDPAQSRVAGNVGYAPVPEGPCGRSPFIGGWGYTINPFSSQKEAAWYFIQWFTSKSMNLNMKMEGWPSPRASAWSSEEFKQVDPNPEFTEVVLESLAIANAEMNPPVAPGREAREVVGIIGTSVIQGVTGDALKAVADAQNIELQRLIDAME
jgi:multiple sugar transport system substrate-binding protein